MLGSLPEVVARGWEDGILTHPQECPSEWVVSDLRLNKRCSPKTAYRVRNERNPSLVLLTSLPSALQAEQAGNPVSINVPQVQLINPENQIVEASDFPHASCVPGPSQCSETWGIPVLPFKTSPTSPLPD